MRTGTAALASLPDHDYGRLDLGRSNDRIFRAVDWLRAFLRSREVTNRLRKRQ
jgi:hypothetical protein